MAVGDGWGRDEWGLGPWGGDFPLAPLTILNAYAISTKEVQVELSREAQVDAPTVEGDALNPATWLVQRVTAPAFTFSVIAVRQLGPTTFVVTVLQDFFSNTVTHRISSTTLKDAEGSTILPGSSADFRGVLNAKSKDTLTRAQRDSNAMQDVANPPVPQSDVATLAGGTLVITSGGDYALETGVSLAKKLILRRLTIPQGGFFHLPEYGIGVRVKDTPPAADLLQLRAEYLRQVEREPEVGEADVRLTLDASGILTVQVRAKLLATGELLSASFKVAAGVAL